MKDLGVVKEKALTGKLISKKYNKEGLFGFIRMDGASETVYTNKKLSENLEDLEIGDTVKFDTTFFIGNSRKIAKGAVKLLEKSEQELWDIFLSSETVSDVAEALEG